ncbi:MOSC domain-containing protein [Salinisphaera sp. Q1T1-3]|uniref:MOSC domain-containing protein n=1 Tax=Salinisphaera sp. Q1T1-3 TaxID=2321229 RepID=UPI0011C47445|nr:MOSC domain-containing protein [Salinisphaera sp. Q1T1-3]
MATSDEVMTTGAGRVVGLYVTAVAGAPMDAIDCAEAVAGQGLIGDRYQAGCGTFSGRYAIGEGARALSLIDTADIARCGERLGRSIAPADLRRNLAIAGLDLLVLRGRRLVIGDVVVRLIGRCAPCGYLSRLLQADMRAGLYRGGGVRAAIETGGALRLGDRVTVIGQ